MSREAMQQALEALSHHRNQGRDCIEQRAYDALRAALEAQQEPAQPQGWVPAPQKATIQMLVAGRLALYHASTHDIEASETEMAEAWEAMMAARLQPKEPQA